MSIVKLLQRSELFAGLTTDQIEKIAALSRKATFNEGDVIIHEGEPTNDMYIVRQGAVEVLVSAGTIPDVPGAPQLTSLVHLGQGQFFGEMALVDHGVRSATVRCTEDDTILYAIKRQDLLTLCENDLPIGYVLMRNIAYDLSFKLRHRNLSVTLQGGDTP
jgi:CRP-like cAMP-binding protein